jgi:hypothetical protein
VRQTVFSREMLYVFERNTVTQDERRLAISASLFGCLWNPEKRRHTLRSEIRTRDHLEECLAKLSWVTSELRSDLADLFDIGNEDLVIPPELLKLFKANGKIAVFTGAGASRIMGIPSWDSLANSAIAWLEAKRQFSHVECEYLRREFKDPKQLITIFHDCVKLDTPEAREFYTQTLRQDVNGQQKLNNSLNVYPALAALECIKITTNIEDEFGRGAENYYSKSRGDSGANRGSSQPPVKVERICVPSGEFRDSTLSSQCIYHLHGRLETLPNAVMTTRGYVQAYYKADQDKDHPAPVFSFLERVLADYTVIFIGASLSEFVILERVLKELIQGKNTDRCHYALMPVRTSEMGEFRLQESYLKHLGIHPLPYFLDGDGYSRLHAVLTAWADQVIKARGTHVYKQLDVIRGAL